jgi:CDP-4-dehydro-6-deoxyglucose reductase
MALQPWQKGTVVGIHFETPDTKRFKIKADALPVFDFVPGQFVTLDLPIDDKPNKRWRSYSIASWPDGTNEFELLIVLNPNGKGTPYLFNEISIGSEITFRGPQGVFTLHTPIDKDLYLICTGTGIAPFRSMVQQIHHQGLAYKNIYLIYGCRKKDNLLYYDELTALQKSMPNFHYIPTLSREEWEGKSGYVHDIYEALCEHPTPASFYLCGWRFMLDEAKERILKMGYDKKDIHQEIYG